MEDIPKDSEVAWDYAMTENNDWFMVCHCGAPECRKLITGYRNLPPDFRARYKGFISQWLIDAGIPYEGPAAVRGLKRGPASYLVDGKSLEPKQQGPWAS